MSLGLGRRVLHFWNVQGGMSVAGRYVGVAKMGNQGSLRGCEPVVSSVGVLVPSGTLLAANSIFFHCPISCPHLCLVNFKLSSHFANRRHFHFMRHLQIGFDLVFTTESVKTPPSLFELS
jgi:hypothetical protein